MDPNTALENLRKLVAELEAQLDLESGLNPETASELVDAFYGLDQWISKGGFLPRQWERHRV